MSQHNGLGLVDFPLGGMDRRQAAGRREGRRRGERVVVGM